MFLSHIQSRNAEQALNAVRGFVSSIGSLAHQFECKVETTDDFGGRPAAYIDIFPIGTELAKDHKKFGGIFVRIWMFGEPVTFTTGIFLGAERAEQSEPRRGVAFTRRHLGHSLETFETTEGFSYHTWSSGNFPWTTRSSRAVARQLEQFVTFRQDTANSTQQALIESHVRKAIIFLDQNLRLLEPISDFGKAIIQEYYSENLPEPAEGSIDTVTISGFVASPLSLSLLTKPFLILTGPSGTGKTRGAVVLAESVCGDDCHKLVAVGADWTDNRHVLGYLNPLETDGERRPIYETTPILDLILQANENPHQPHVLILDEMNLSHVERYFADFLSAMELKDKSGALKLHAAGTAVTRTGVPVHGSINFPSNLFVIGTVNIDETTYMFSPKVLDRANVIEIHADKTALGNFLRGIESAGGGPKAKDYGISFLDAAQVIQAEKKEDQEHTQVPPLPETVKNAAADHLMALFNIMKRGRGEYGFRTGKEVMAYLRTAHFLAGPDEAGRTAWATGENWHEALDAQILQKILPKLHGSRSRLAPLLGALATYCASGEEAHAMEHFPTDGAAPKRNLAIASTAAKRSDDETGEKPIPQFKNSYQKLCRMIDVLVEEQFVSFIC